ncbi:MAG: hypothetical protein Q6368_007200 [Candidatus Baldrarchaeota archaeon]
MGSINPIRYCLNEARKLARKEHFGAALIYLVQAAEIAAKKTFRRKKRVKITIFFSLYTISKGNWNN